MARRWQHGSPSSAAQPALASDGAAQPSSLPGGAAQPTLLSDGAEQPMTGSDESFGGTEISTSSSERRRTGLRLAHGILGHAEDTDSSRGTNIMKRSEDYSPDEMQVTIARGDGTETTHYIAIYAEIDEWDLSWNQLIDDLVECGILPSTSVTSWIGGELVATGPQGQRSLKQLGLRSGSRIVINISEREGSLENEVSRLIDEQDEFSSRRPWSTGGS